MLERDMGRPAIVLVIDSKCMVHCHEQNVYTSVMQAASDASPSNLGADKDGGNGVI